MPAVKKKPGRNVRCLAPGPEHTFWSEDPCSRRICPRCMGKIDQMERFLLRQAGEVKDGRRDGHNSKAT